MNENNKVKQNDNVDLNNELDRLTAALENITIEQRRLRRRSDEIQNRIRNIQLQQRGRTTVTANQQRSEEYLDRHGDEIEIGDYVNFLTSGRFKSRAGTVTQINRTRFISARDKSGRIINREPANVEIVRKHNEQHDRRRRFE